MENMMIVAFNPIKEIMCHVLQIFDTDINVKAISRIVKKNR